MPVDPKSNREWDQISSIRCDDTLNGWYRFQTEIASDCEDNPLKNGTTVFGKPCGATFRGWMPYRHPTISEGRVQRKICFSYDGKCDCEFTTTIAVRNCGNFFVYRLRKVPICKARYCGASKGQIARGEQIFLEFES